MGASIRRSGTWDSAPAQAHGKDFEETTACRTGCQRYAGEWNSKREQRPPLTPSLEVTWQWKWGPAYPGRGLLAGLPAYLALWVSKQRFQWLRWVIAELGCFSFAQAAATARRLQARRTYVLGFAHR